MESFHVCPWWLGAILASPLRKLWQDPHAILAPWIRPGMTVLEPGPGMGFFTLELARLVGPSGRVVALEMQPQMRDGLLRRVRRAGLETRVDARVVAPTTLAIDDLTASVDFAFAFAVVHEMPDATVFYREVADALRPGARLLVVEPAGHVGTDDFRRQVEAAHAVGLRREDAPAMRKSHTALFVRSGAAGPI